MEEHDWLLKNGLLEEVIQKFYMDIAEEILQSNDRYNDHNLPMYGKDTDDENHCPDIFAYQSGSQRKSGEEKLNDQTDWSSIKICIVPLATEDGTEIYVESVTIIKQLGDVELENAIRSLSTRQQTIMELLVEGWPQKKIAAYLGISNAAVSKHASTIEKTLEPYFVKKHWLRLT